jgi:hypothetical protein
MGRNCEYAYGSRTNNPAKKTPPALGGGARQGEARPCLAGVRRCRRALSLRRLERASRVDRRAIHSHLVSDGFAAVKSQRQQAQILFQQDADSLATSLQMELLHVNPSRRYLLISPCRDEAQYLRHTLDSVAAQSVPPALWVVVDDGSTDETPAILEEYARRLSYLRVVRRTDRGHRHVGPGVIDAFYAGLETVRVEDFDYVCKLDMDLHLPVRYFELLMRRMESDPRVGTTSGKPWFVHPQSGALMPEVCGDEMSVGMTKFYRVACFKEIGGFVRQVMWDGIDCHRARRAPAKRASGQAGLEPGSVSISWVPRLSITWQ